MVRGPTVAVDGRRLVVGRALGTLGFVALALAIVLPWSVVEDCFFGCGAPHDFSLLRPHGGELNPWAFIALALCLFGLLGLFANGAHRWLFAVGALSLLTLGLGVFGVFAFAPMLGDFVGWRAGLFVALAGWSLVVLGLRRLAANGRPRVA